MKFGFRNIPPIREAELELGDLTIIAGKNNSGKTYLAYALYGFLKGCRAWPAERRREEISVPAWSAEGARPEDPPPDWARIVDELRRTGRMGLKVSPAALREHRDHVVKILARDFVREQLPGVFRVAQEEFADAEIRFSNERSDFVGGAEARYAPNARMTIEYDGTTLEINAHGSSRERIETPRWLTNALARAYVLFLFSDVPEPFVLTGERLGIPLFYRELDFTRSKLVELLQEHTGESGRDDLEFPYLVIDKASNRYALPISDNISYTRELPDRNGGKGLAEEWVGDELSAVVDGEFVSRGGEVRYRSVEGASEKFDIPLHRASSSARALMPLDFFLRHDAHKGQLLIVDEPESHLDVYNQVALARLLAKTARAGVRVLVTTHSDYFVKEINNLIMASHFGPESPVVRKQGYEGQARLPASSVRAYMTREGVLERCAVDEYGIDVPIFEEAIRKIDRRSRGLAAELYESLREADKQ